MKVLAKKRININLSSEFFFFFFFGFQGNHFMVASLPIPPFIYMNPTGFTAEGSMKYEITGYFAEVFHNLQVSYTL